MRGRLSASHAYLATDVLNSSFPENLLHKNKNVLHNNTHVSLSTCYYDNMSPSHINMYDTTTISHVALPIPVTPDATPLSPIKVVMTPIFQVLEKNTYIPDAGIPECKQIPYNAPNTPPQVLRTPVTTTVFPHAN